MTAARVDQAVVLAAGRATRLRPLSAVRAKAAMPVAGQPLVRRLLAWLAAQGVRDVVVNLHHLPHTITAVVGDGSDLGVRVRYSWEPRLLGTAGGVRRALTLLEGECVVVVNADTLTTVSLEALAAHHVRTGARVTLALVPHPDPSRYGGVVVESGWVTGFVPPGSERVVYHFVGVQVVEARAVAALPEGEPAEMVADVYRPLLAEGRGTIAAYIADATFHDIGTPADYLAASLAVARADGVRRDPVAGEIPAGDRCRVAPTARLVRTILWDDVTVEADVELTECIVADGVRVPAGTRWTRRMLVPAGLVPSGSGDEVLGNVAAVPIR